MTLDELKEILEETVGSDYRITIDKRGRIVVHTGLVEDSDGELVSANEIEEVDFDPDEDEVDFDELDEDDDE